MFSKFVFNIYYFYSELLLNFTIDCDCFMVVNVSQFCMLKGTTKLKTLYNQITDTGEGHEVLDTPDPVISMKLSNI